MKLNDRKIFDSFLFGDNIARVKSEIEPKVNDIITSDSGVEYKVTLSTAQGDEYELFLKRLT